MSTLEKKNAAGTLNLLTIDDADFKTGRLSVRFHLPLNKETAARNALAIHLLSRTCRAYPDVTALNCKLSSMYGAAVFASVARLGDYQVLSLTLYAVRDEFLPEGESVAGECAALLREMLFDPALEDGFFPASAVEQEKRCLKELIEAELNEKRMYARNRCEAIMFEGDPYGVPKCGTVEAVEALSPQDVTEAWREMLKNAHIVVSGMGISPDDPLLDALSAASGNGTVETRTKSASVPKEIRTVTERLPVAQAKLVLGFAAPSDDSDEQLCAMRAACALLGGTAHSKFFLNVREKLHLCYYCSARYDRVKGVMLVECGIEPDNYEKAYAEILRQIDAVRAGDFTDDELKATIMSMQNSLYGCFDHKTALAGFYEGQLLSGRMDSPEKRAEQLGGVTREQVVGAANRLALDTVYLLTGEEDAQ